jgi:hypothetical protein
LDIEQLTVLQLLRMERDAQNRGDRGEQLRAHAEIRRRSRWKRLRAR